MLSRLEKIKKRKMAAVSVKMKKYSYFLQIHECTQNNNVVVGGADLLTF